MGLLDQLQAIIDKRRDEGYPDTSNMQEHNRAFTRYEHEQDQQAEMEDYLRKFNETKALRETLARAMSSPQKRSPAGVTDLDGGKPYIPSGANKSSVVKSISPTVRGPRKKYNEALETLLKSKDRLKDYGVNMTPDDHGINPTGGTRNWKKSIPSKKKKPSQEITLPTLDITGTVPEDRKIEHEWRGKPNVPVEINLDEEINIPPVGGKGTSILQDFKKSVIDPTKKLVVDPILDVLDPITPDLSSGDFSMEPGKDWGGNIGAGMAALGDALMAGGGMKSSFLDGVIKARETRRQEPLKRFKVFQKMLHDETIRKNTEAYRSLQLGLQGKRIDQQATFKKEDRKIGEEKTAWDRRRHTPGSKEVIAKMKTFLEEGAENLFRKGYIELYKKDPIGFAKTQTLDDIDKQTITYQAIRPKTKKESATASQSLQLLNPLSKAIAKDLIDPDVKLEDLTAEQLKTLDPKIKNQKDKIQKLAMDTTKGKIANVMDRLGNTLPKFLTTVLSYNGIPGGRFKDIKIDTEGKRIMYYPPDKLGQATTEGVELKLPGVHIGKFSFADPSDIWQSLKKTMGLSGKPGYATAVNALFEGVYQPLKNLDFGASQSAKELKSFLSEAGKDTFTGTPQLKMQFILGVAQRLRSYVEARENKFLALSGGKYFLKANEYYTTEQFDKPHYADRIQVGAMAEKAVGGVRYKMRLKGNEWNSKATRSLPVWYQKFMRRELKNMITDEDRIGGRETFFKTGSRTYYDKKTHTFTDHIVEDDPFHNDPLKNRFKKPNQWNIDVWNEYLKIKGLNKR